MLSNLNAVFRFVGCPGLAFEMVISYLFVVWLLWVFLKKKTVSYEINKIMTSLLDDALHYIGKYGRYQVFACVIITIIGAWFPPLHIMGAIFSADRPISYHCIQWSDAGGNIVGSRPEKETTRVELSSDDVITSDECTGSLGFNNKTSEEVVCTDWKYDTEYNESTIVTQVWTWKYYYN